jgi:hypothetical protein
LPTPWYHRSPATRQPALVCQYHSCIAATNSDTRPVNLPFIRPGYCTEGRISAGAPGALHGGYIRYIYTYAGDLCGMCTGARRGAPVPVRAHDPRTVANRLVVLGHSLYSVRGERLAPRLHAFTRRLYSAIDAITSIGSRCTSAGFQCCRRRVRCPATS